MTLLRAVHCIATIDPETGGPARTVTSLCSALTRRGVGATLVTQEPRVQPLPFALPPEVRFTRRGRFVGLVDFRRALGGALEGPAPVLLHDHGVWLPNNHAAAQLASMRNVPRVVSPRGMLDGWAMSWHGWRKRVAWRLYQRRDLERAHLLHATSEAEAESLRALGFHQPIAVIPNGVDVLAPLAGARPEGPRVALFLSRIHPKKGLLHLIEAWGRLKPSGWALWIAGSGELAHVAEVEAAARAIEGAGATRVRFLGNVSDQERAGVLAQAELFVLPTLSENFGQVVAEALAAGLPVITTKAAPWPMLPEQGAGWWIEAGTEPLVASLRDATALPTHVLAEKGAHGRAWVEATLAWDAVAGRMAAVYAWLCGRGEVPADVREEIAA